MGILPLVLSLALRASLVAEYKGIVALFHLIQFNWPFPIKFSPVVLWIVPPSVANRLGFAKRRQYDCSQESVGNQTVSIALSI